MSRVWLILAVIELAFMIFVFVDVLLTHDSRVRGVPKIVWLVIVLLLSPVGGILWFAIGKEPAAAGAPAGSPRGASGRSVPSRPVAPDDDPDFLLRLRMKEEQDERIRRLEQELADLDDDQPDGK